MSKKETKTKIAILTHEFPPMHGGVGVSSDRISKILSKVYNVHVIHFIQKKGFVPVSTVSKRVKDDRTIHEVFFSNYSSQIDTDITVHESSFKGVREQQECFISLSKLQEKESFDILLCLFFTNLGKVATLVAKKYGVKNIAAIRGNDIGKHIFMPELFSDIEYILRNSDYVTSVNQELLDVANTITTVKDKSSVIHNSIDLNELDDLKKVTVDGLSTDIPVIATAGIFRFKKGILYLIDALSKVNLDFHLLLIGDYKSNKEKELHERYITEKGLDDRVYITGMIDYKDRFDYTSLADIVVIPSLFSEGCPSTLLEAMALKKPIICSDAGACPEIITDNESGYIVPQGSTEELLEKINILLESKVKRNTLGQAAYEKVQKMTYEKELNEWKVAFNKVFEQ